ncbi:MAG: L-rhamnose mutarotase [Rhodobacteraceae bacterium]|nr:L-rhamnose mutarotase [Paracoccaceae bacterium]
MTYYAWRAQLTAGSFEAYRKAHAEMPSDMTNALRRAGYADYRIFAHEDGALFGTFRCDDIDTLRARLAREEANWVWQEKMRELLIRDLDPSTGFPRLMMQVFDLDGF